MYVCNQKFIIQALQVLLYSVVSSNSEYEKHKLENTIADLLED